MSYTAEVARAQRPRRSRLLVPLIAGAVLLLVAAVALVVWLGVRSSSDPSVAAPGSSSAAGTAVTTVPTAGDSDPDGHAACTKVAAWLKSRVNTGGAPDDPVVLWPIGEQAARSTNEAVRTAGTALVEKSKLAIAGKGTESDFSTMMNMGSAGINLGTECLKAGY